MNTMFSKITQKFWVISLGLLFISGSDIGYDAEKIVEEERAHLKKIKIIINNLQLNDLLNIVRQSPKCVEKIDYFDGIKYPEVAKALEYIEKYKDIDDPKSYLITVAAIERLGEIGGKDLVNIFENLYKELKKPYKDNSGKYILRSIHDCRIPIMEALSKAVVHLETKDKVEYLPHPINIWMNIHKECIKNYKGGQKDIRCAGVSNLIVSTKYSDEEITEILKYRDDEDMKGIIIGILNSNPSKMGLETLINYTKCQDIGNKYWSIRAIQKIGDKSAIPILNNIVNNRNEHEKVRKAAEKAIEVLSK